MKNFIPFFTFALLTGFTAVNELPVISAGCSGSYNKKVKVKCEENDIKCQSEKSKNLNIKDSVKS